MAESWTPKPQFNIEDSSYIETLTFVSGMSYALTESNNELQKQNKANFMCNSPSAIGSKIIIEILNSKYKGSITSEQAVSGVVLGLKERFPCK